MVFGRRQAALNLINFFAVCERSVLLTFDTFDQGWHEFSALSGVTLFCSHNFTRFSNFTHIYD